MKTCPPHGLGFFRDNIVTLEKAIQYLVGAA